MLGAKRSKKSTIVLLLKRAGAQPPGPPPSCASVYLTCMFANYYESTFNCVASLAELALAIKLFLVIQQCYNT